MDTPRFYDTLTRNLLPIAAQPERRLGIYCCGPTVYDAPHAGHARVFVVFDVLVRYLRSQDRRVTYVRNITDVDDKILKRAKKNGEEPLALSARMARVFQDQMHAIGCMDPDVEPKVSEHLPQIHAIISTLIENGSAYVAEMPNGTRDVYFSVRSFSGYGKLSRRKIDELIAGARVEKDEESKRDPLDFALWKGAKAGEWGWESPWGYGRPGWHIECSAMSKEYLGHGFDIHAGGMDLIFPHHENEIAQSESAEPSGGDMARCWMHNGFLNVDKEKMSKSLGNFVTVSDVLQRNDPEGFRWFLLTVHYRGPMQFDTEKLESGRVVFPGVDEAERRVDYLYTTLSRLEALILGSSGATVPSRPPPELMPLREQMDQAQKDALAGLADDLNTPVALAGLGELARLGNELADLAQKRKKDPRFSSSAALLARTVMERIRGVTSVMGLLQTPSNKYFERTRILRLELRGLSAEEVDAKVRERDEARKNKDFARSDALRAELTALGIDLRDTPEGSVWSIGV